MTPKVIFVIGPAAAGKTTICGLLSSEEKVSYISCGNLSRELAKESSRRGRYIKRYVSSSQSIPSMHMVNHIILPKLEELSKQNPGQPVLIDGFPRTVEHLDELGKLSIIPEIVLLFHCLESIRLQRYLTRQAVGREGDDEALFQRRLAKYMRLSPSIIEYYRERVLLVDFDSSTATDISYRRLIRLLKQDNRWMRVAGRGMKLRSGKIL